MSPGRTLVPGSSLAVAALVRAQAPAPSPTPAVTVLRAARMFDGRSDATVPDAVVIVQDGQVFEAPGAAPR